MKKLLALGLVFLTLILPITSLAYEEPVEFAVREFHTIAAKQAVSHKLILFPPHSAAPNEVVFALRKGSTSSGGYPTLTMIVNDFSIYYYLEDYAAAVNLFTEAEKIFGGCILEETTIIYVDFVNEINRYQRPEANAATP